MGYSGNSRTRVVGISFVLFLSALLLTEYSNRDPRVAKLGSAVIAQILAPIQVLNHGVGNKISNLWSNYVAVLDLKQEHSRLQHRVTALEAENLRLREFEGENERLREMISLVESNKFSSVGAIVIGYDTSNWIQQVTIDKGSSNGIEAGMPVLSGRGVVGQVKVVAPGVSKVILITDPASGVDALVQSSRARGVVTGSGLDLCEMRYVLREHSVAIGDRVITSGMDGVFPKGLQLGIISKFNSRSFGLFQTVEVEPVVDFSKLEEVVVITNAKQILKSAQVDEIAEIE